MGLICTPYGYSGAARVPGLSYQGVILGDKPVAYWPLNEVSGTVAHDLSGNGINGTINGGVTLGEPGIPGAPGAFLFDGASGYILTGASSLLSVGSSGTVEAWVSVNDTTSGYSNDIVSVSYNSGYRVRCSPLAPNLIYESAQILTAGNIAAQKWTHLVFVFPTGASPSIYINGQLNTTGGSGFPGLYGSSYPAYIGQAGATPNEFFGGYMSNVAVYNTALTATQILNHYNAGTA